MKRFLIIALVWAAFLPTPARATVTNYSNAAVTRRNLANVTNALVQSLLAEVQRRIDTSTNAGAQVTSAYATFDSSSNITFTVSGKSYSYATAVSRPTYTDTGLLVVHSTLTNVPVGAVFAKKSANEYPTTQCGELTALWCAEVEWTNNQYVTEFSWWNSDESVRYTSLERGNSWIVQRMTNMVYTGEFEVIECELTREQAQDAGVTNAVSSVRPFSLLDFLVPRAYAGGTVGSVAEGFILSVNVGTKNSPIWKTIAIEYKFTGERVNWDETFLTASERDFYYYSPTYWPTETVWKDYNSWITFPVSINVPYYATDEDKASDTLSYQLMSLDKTQFVRRFGDPSGGIPAFEAPVKKERDQKKMACSKRRIGHRWKNCVCLDCDTTRAHNLVAVGGGLCDRCHNRDGYECDTSGNALTSGSYCNSTKAYGGQSDVSAVTHHHGWHDSDDIPYNAGICSCECEDWQESHVTDGAVITPGTYEPGFRDPDTGAITLSTTYHHGKIRCQRGMSDSDQCAAIFWANEYHTKDPNDTTPEYSSSSQSGYHVVKYSCSKCEGEIEELEAHYQDPTQDNPCLCVCGEYFHDFSTKSCGSSHTYTACTRCGEYYGTAPAAYETEDGHTFGTYKDNKYHTCLCGYLTQQHYDGNADGICDACGYVMSTGRGRQKKGPFRKHERWTLDPDDIDPPGEGEDEEEDEPGVLPEPRPEPNPTPKPNPIKIVIKIDEEWFIPTPNTNAVFSTATVGGVTWRLYGSWTTKAYHWEMLWFPTPVYNFTYINDRASQETYGKCYYTITIDWYELYAKGFTYEFIEKLIAGGGELPKTERED